MSQYAEDRPVTTDELSPAQVQTIHSLTLLGAEPTVTYTTVARGLKPIPADVFTVSAPNGVTTLYLHPDGSLQLGYGRR